MHHQYWTIRMWQVGGVWGGLLFFKLKKNISLKLKDMNGVTFPSYLHPNKIWTHIILHIIYFNVINIQTIIFS